VPVDAVTVGVTTAVDEGTTLDVLVEVAAVN